MCFGVLSGIINTELNGNSETRVICTPPALYATWVIVNLELPFLASISPPVGMSVGCNLQRDQNTTRLLEQQNLSMMPLLTRLIDE